MLRSGSMQLVVAMATTSLVALGCGDNLEGGAGGEEPDAGGGNTPPITNVISGTVTVHPGSVVDSDVNDPGAPFADNNTTATAQSVPTPMTLGGYVNTPGAGPQGRSQASGDVVDVFKVNLEAGQLVLLSFDPDDPAGPTDAQAALQIYLLDLQGNPVMDRDDYPIEGRYQAESVRYFFAERSGEFLIAVQAIKGASTYALLVDDYHGDALSQSAAPYARGQVVARFVPGLMAASVARPGNSHREVAFVAGAANREMLVRFDAMRPGAFLAAWGGQHLDLRAPRAAGSRREVRGPVTPRTAAMLMESDPTVDVAGPNFILRPSFVPNDTHYDVQWGFENINAEAAWDVANGEGVVVAVIDTGVDVDHPDLEANLTAGYDFVRDPDNAGDGDGIDADPSQTPDGSHGTHVSGTIAAVTNNDRGVAGLAWGAKVMPLRALGLEGGTEYDVGQALRYASGLDNDSGTVPDTPARVINMSLGGPESSRWFQRSVYDVVRNGTVVVAAAGNDNSAAPAYPAWYNHVISVASTNDRNRKSGFSNYGPQVDLAAPGSMIGSTWGDGAYSYSSGTSMASPHAAAWIALMISANPELTPFDIENIITKEDVFTDLGSSGRDDDFGYGLIDAKKAVDVATAYQAGTPVVIPELAMAPDQVIFGPLQSTISIAGANIGEGVLNVAGAAPSAPWVSVGGFNSVDNGVELTLTVDRSTLTEPGVYQTEVKLDMGGESHTLPVLVIVRDEGDPGSVGRQYVSLVDDGTVVRTAPVEDGAYQFSRVEDGAYRVVVHTDLDNDGSDCGRGETCGRYGGLESPVTASPVANDVDVVSDWMFQ